LALDFQIKLKEGFFKINQKTFAEQKKSHKQIQIIEEKTKKKSIH
jgi:hypothetical protein